MINGYWVSDKILVFDFDEIGNNCNYHFEVVLLRIMAKERNVSFNPGQIEHIAAKEIAQLALFLAFSNSSYITGSDIIIRWRTE